MTDHSLLGEDVLIHCFNYLSAWELKALVTPVCGSWKRVAEQRLNLVLAIPGQEVLLHSLKNKSILNGRIGIIVKCKSKTRRSVDETTPCLASSQTNKTRLLVKLQDSCVSLSVRNLKFVGLFCPPELESLLVQIINFPPVDDRREPSYGIPRAELDAAKLYGFLRGAPGAYNLILRCDRCEDAEQEFYLALSETTAKGSVRLQCRACLVLQAAKHFLSLAQGKDDSTYTNCNNSLTNNDPNEHEYTYQYEHVWNFNFDALSKTAVVKFISNRLMHRHECLTIVKGHNLIGIFQGDMETSMVGDDIGEISIVALGGGGIGAVWGETSHEEAVETLRLAVKSGINLLDMAPMYGVNREAEHCVGEAFQGKLPNGVKILTKVYVGNIPAAKVEERVRKSLAKSLMAMKLPCVDILVLHSNIVPDDWSPPLSEEHSPILGVNTSTRWSAYINGWIPCVAKLKNEGIIKNWGITGIGEPKTIIDALQYPQKPRVVEAIANCYDMIGSLKTYKGPAMPREIIRKAVERDVIVLGIRAVAAGSLCDALDRKLEMDTPEKIDWYKARAFRELAKRKGITAAQLAHRYSFSMPGITSTILGVKNRTELMECIAAAKQGKLSADQFNEIDLITAFARL